MSSFSKHISREKYICIIDTEHECINIIIHTVLTHPIEPARRFWMTLLGSVPANKSTRSISAPLNMLIWAGCRLISERCSIQILARTPATLTDILVTFLDPPPDNCEDSTPLGHDGSFQILSNSLFTDHPIIQSMLCRLETDSIVKQMMHTTHVQKTCLVFPISTTTDIVNS
jgi:hypothetical protein